MSFVSNISLKVVAKDSQLLRSETYDIFFGTKGQPPIPERLGVAVEELICFLQKK
jgi:hypothetical protein